MSHRNSGAAISILKDNGLVWAATGVEEIGLQPALKVFEGSDDGDLVAALSKLCMKLELVRRDGLFALLQLSPRTRLPKRTRFNDLQVGHTVLRAGLFHSARNLRGKSAIAAVVGPIGVGVEQHLRVLALERMHNKFLEAALILNTAVSLARRSCIVRVIIVIASTLDGRLPRRRHGPARAAAPSGLAPSGLCWLSAMGAGSVSEHWWGNVSRDYRELGSPDGTEVTTGPHPRPQEGTAGACGAGPELRTSGPDLLHLPPKTAPRPGTRQIAPAGRSLSPRERRRV